MALVDHVFAEVIQQSFSKQDILDMMEVHGLIGKFSCWSSKDERQQTYFVPAQLKSTPSGLCKINPSESDPCPLYLHFKDGFVPHGFFCQLLSRCISWCSEHGLNQAPQLFHNGARLFIAGMQSAFDLILICKRKFIKVVLKTRCSSLIGSSLIAVTTKMANEVRTFLDVSLRSLASELSWLRNLQFELCVACSQCLQNGEKCNKHKTASCSHDDCLPLLPVHPEEELICTKIHSGEAIHVNGLEKWFKAYQAEASLFYH